MVFTVSFLAAVPTSAAVLQAGLYRNAWQNDLNIQGKIFRSLKIKSARELTAAIALASGFLVSSVFAQTGPAPYGAPITIEQAKKP